MLFPSATLFQTSIKYVEISRDGASHIKQSPGSAIGAILIRIVYILITGAPREQAYDAVFCALFKTRVKAGLTLGATSASVVVTAVNNRECRLISHVRGISNRYLISDHPCPMSHLKFPKLLHPI